MSHSNNNNLSLSLQWPSSTAFKGVVSQQNGHWGAQIYANHQRVWLGTFKTERDAAMAYDRASMKLRSSDSYRNLSLSPEQLTLEIDFQSHFSADVLLVMIKDGSYQTKLSEFSRFWSDRQAGIMNSHYPGGVMQVGVGGGVEEIIYKDYFEKELTPSDVSKLNRLVIPKKHAVKFFPQVTDQARFVSGGDIPEADLEFFDRTMRRWTFRYCYWKSSQSFVFTKGWNKFVKEKGIKTKDVVVFYNCEMKPRPGMHHDVTTFTMIDYRHCEDEEIVADRAGPSGTVNADEENDDKPEMNQDQEENVEPQRRELRLFGVNIS